MGTKYIYNVMCADFEGDMIPCDGHFNSLLDATTAILKELERIYKEMGVELPEVTFKEEDYTWTYVDEYENLYKVYQKEIS